MVAINAETIRIGFVAMLHAQLVAAARRRSTCEVAEIAAYLETPEFLERAARLEPRVREGITVGRPIPLRKIAAELHLPRDVAVSWLSKIGLPLDVAIGGRGRA